MDGKSIKFKHHRAAIFSLFRTYYKCTTVFQEGIKPTISEMRNENDIVKLLSTIVTIVISELLYHFGHA